MPSRPLRPALLPKLERTKFFRHQRLEAVKAEVCGWMDGPPCGAGWVVAWWL